MKKSLTPGISLCLALFPCTRVAAQLYNVDWGKNNPDSVLHTGAAAIGSVGDLWNTTDPEANVLTDLVDISDASGTASDVDVVWSDELQSSVNVGAIEFGSTGHNALMEDYGFTAPGTTATVTISGLEANLTYTLYLYGVPDGASQDTTFTVIGANESPQTVTAGATNDDNGLASPEDYVIFTGNTGSTGEIAFTQTGSTFSASNGFQLELGSTNTTPPSAPSLVTPADSASRVSVFPTLAWSSGTGADSYKVYLWESSGTAPELTDPPTASGPGLSYETDELSPLTSYSWFVVSTNALGEAASDTFSFTTSEAPSLPFDLLLNVDFQKADSPTYSGAAVTGLPGDFWNTTDTESNVFTDLENLLDSTGTPTTVSVLWSDELQSSTNPAAIEFGSTGHNDLMEDYAFTAPGTTATVTISGLEPDLNYTLYLYGVPDGASQDTTFTVIDANEGAQTVLAGGVNDDNGLATPEDYVVFTGIIGASGQIVYTQTGTSFSGSNGLQLGLIQSGDVQLEISSTGSDLEFRWNSRNGQVYDLVSSTNLDTTPDTWDVVPGFAAIPADPSGQNQLLDFSLPASTRTFYAIREYRP